MVRAEYCTMVQVTDDILRDATNRLVRELSPERVYLFGSHAYGSPNSDSDVDFMVVVAESTESPIQMEIRGRASLREFDFPIDVLVRTVSDFERRASWPSCLESVVRDKGRLLYAN